MNDLGSVAALIHYPIKGLSGQHLDHVSLRQGEGFEHDRVWGFARPGVVFDEDDPQPMFKTNFLMLMYDAALARASTHFDPEAEILAITVDGEKRQFELATSSGARAAAEALARIAGLPPGEGPKLVRGRSHRFPDNATASPEMMNAVSIINLASVEDLAAKVGSEVDPMRFRGNILVENWPAFAEFDLMDRDIKIGGARFKFVERIKRCVATEVNPTTGERDLSIPRLLRMAYGHVDMGVRALVCGSGTLRAGDPIAVDARTGN